MAALKKTAWNTYAVRGYTYDAANDQLSAGGVHLHQIRLGAQGWQGRIMQVNGHHTAAGPIWMIDPAAGEALFCEATE